MPIVVRAERDVTRLLGFVDGAVNTVNLVGAMGAGVAKAYRDLYPELLPAYRAALDSGALSLENPIHVYTAPNDVDIINLVTKRHFSDNSRLEDVIASIKKFTEYLDINPSKAISLPMMGCGNGKLEYKDVLPHVLTELDHYPNIIHLCMDPRRMDKIPKYLGIVGSRTLASDEWYDKLKVILGKALLRWGLESSETVVNLHSVFDGVVSGYAQGIDSLAAIEDPDDPRMTIAKEFNLKPIGIKPNWAKYRKSAGFRRNGRIVDIATHIVAIVDNSVDSNGTRSTIDIVRGWNTKYPDNKKELLVVNVNKPS